MEFQFYGREEMSNHARNWIKVILGKCVFTITLEKIKVQQKVIKY